MKLDQISQRDIILNEITRRAASSPDMVWGSDSYYEDLENAYLDFEKLETAFATGNFGSLIGKRADQITERDITVIKNRILQILENNPFLRGENFEHHSGKEVMHIFAHLVSHGIETTLLAALTAAFAGIAGEETIHGDGVLAALSGVGAVLTAGGIAVQVKTIKALWAAYRLVKIVDAYQTVTNFDPADYKRSLWARFLDWIEGKTPDQIRREAERRIEAAAIAKELKFEEEMKNIPMFFEYRDSKGAMKEYPTAKLFEFE